jgi:hypothetical protein
VHQFEFEKLKPHNQAIPYRFKIALVEKHERAKKII